MIHSLLLVGLLGSARADDVATAEAAADARIAACRAEPVDCVGEERELARAFLVKVTAASVLRGEIDRVSAANARLLDRGVVEDWSTLLDADERVQPDPWVVALAAAAWAARVDPTKLQPAKAEPVWPPPLRQTVVELTGGLVPWHPSWATTTYDANLDVRLGFDRDLGLRLDGWLVSGNRMFGQTGHYGGPYLWGGVAAGGGRWRPLRRGGEQLFTAGVDFSGAGASRRADRLSFADDGYWAPPPMFGFGVQVRELARISLEPGGRMFATIDFLAAATKWVSLPRSVWRHDGWGAETENPASDRAELDLALGIEWRPRPEVRIGMDGRFELDLGLSIPTRGRPPMHGFLEVRVGWSSPRRPPTVVKGADRAVDTFLDDGTARP